MHERIADILDIVLCVIMAVLCLQSGVRAVVWDNYEVQRYTSSYSEKNTTQKYTPSEKIYGEYDGADSAYKIAYDKETDTYKIEKE